MSSNPRDIQSWPLRPVTTIGALRQFIERIGAEEQLYAPRNPQADWRTWFPGIDNGNETLRAVLSSMPASSPDEVDFMVKIMENPRSPLSPPGAVALPDHDCIHVILGRGFHVQDEAFVIGVTMGSGGQRMRADSVETFRFVASRLYAESDRFSDSDLKVFDAALAYGRTLPAPLYEFDFSQVLGTKLSEIRARLGIEPDELRRIFKREQEMAPGTPASLRLPVTKSLSEQRRIREGEPA